MKNVLTDSMQTFEQFDFCKTLKEILKAQSVTGRTGKIFQKLPALSTKNNLTILRSLMLEFQPKTTLEIGLSFGGSCLTLGATHRDLRHFPTKQHIAIDPFQKTVWDDVGKVLLEKESLLDYVEIIEDFSFNALPELLRKSKVFDLIYIDGSHLFEDVFIDFFYSDKLLRTSGLILFDDSSDANVRKVLNFIDYNLKDYYKKIDLTSYSSGIKKTKTIAANFFKRNQLTVYQKVAKTERPWNSPFRNF
jgi:hypothetical protein